MTNLSKQVARVATIARNRTEKQVIEDLMQMYCNLLTEPAFIEKAFPNTLYRFGKNFRQELTYYKQDSKAWDELQKLSQMYLQTVAEAEPFTDHMTSLYDMEIKGERLGQFLTPPDLAEMIGELQMATSALSEPPSRPYTVGDDMGCGAGSLLLGFIRAVLRKHGKGAVSMLNVIANDLDPEMVKIATVQIVLNSCIHRIPLHSFHIDQANVLSEYMEMTEGKKMAYQWLPNTNDRFYQVAHQAHSTEPTKEPEMA
ncbi:TPA: N-6 DNA methylase [Serratia marcescens]|uniref:N-6 DNA methylase n=1 Tax=Serratia nevei TaxID=2703794 RepID=A0ABT7G5H7_9GAMM|nr:N-6 DNA methylase [Serratia nevei]HAU4290844.1 N-6 DNA methylase [Serratia marcescens]MDK5169014.1 N-6 DNA methylase [Serratia nevei]MDK5298508.1 N-6 DNA methylase [Serratia nevei]MEC5887240.1 N-6 DNA methylase [Serratia nevei]HAU4297502.1 N-6 DNA methylase [Serratia marcescens]